jgi:hypothetical protein
MCRRTLSLCFFLVAALPAVASTIISQTASLTNNRSPQMYASWTIPTPDTFSGVNIAANLASEDGNAASCNAYLVTTQPPTNAASLATNLGVGTSSTAFVPITLFTGLTLGPGSYYLVLGPVTSNLLVQTATPGNTTVTTYPGVNAGADLFATGASQSYGPASTFGTKNALILFSVTGSLGATSVPTLSLWAMLATALFLAVSGLLFVRRFKTAA